MKYKKNLHHRDHREHRGEKRFKTGFLARDFHEWARIILGFKRDRTWRKNKKEIARAEAQRTQRKAKNFVGLKYIKAKRF